MKSDILDRLKSLDYSVATNAINEILKANYINEEDLLGILSLENKLIIGTFLENYTNFQERDLEIIETYINENLEHTDRLFVSDLIEFSTIWDLHIPYGKCLDFLEKYDGDNHYVLLACIDYVFENLKFAYIDKLYQLLYSILHNPESNQSAQVKASFVLFRITNKPEFLADLIDLVVNGNEYNREQLTNILSLPFNQPHYFEYYTILKAITPT